MANCNFCGKKIPPNRRKYCSRDCIKKDWYVKNNDNKTSYYRPETRDEWLKTETGKGYRWEKFIANLMGGEWQGFGNSFDLVVDGKRVDVKTCNLYKRKSKRGKPIENVEEQTGWWVFNRNGNEGTEIFICIGLDNDVPQKIFKIPADDFGNSCTISPNKSKYNKYLI